MPKSKDIAHFKHVVWSFYRRNRRDLPWRPPTLGIRPDGTLEPYAVFISEVMLQQTQVSRVLIKFPQFIRAFPTFEALAKAPLFEVLSVWQGMGYNRRAKYLHESAKAIVTSFDNIFPSDPTNLESLKGIGPATARSLTVFIFNTPQVFIETNIRRVMIHHFFKDEKSISDKEIFPIISRTLDTKNPRQWYYALMDYGSFLGKAITNPNRKSKAYTKQKPFVGSDREIRGAVLKAILAETYVIPEKFSRNHFFPSHRVMPVISDMQEEGLLREEAGRYLINDESYEK